MAHLPHYRKNCAKLLFPAKTDSNAVLSDRKGTNILKGSERFFLSVPKPRLPCCRSATPPVLRKPLLFLL